ncbi:hypothetical protein KC725_02455 [Candidatus Peregrinibacteria bacterium]|nr:hypothetical protein [Candidatus Peregrinibacteria bacterium]
MMNSFNPSTTYLLHHIHIIFAVTALVGTILFIYWATKHLDKKKLTSWIIGLLAVGIIGMLLTSAYGWNAMGDHMMHGHMYDEHLANEHMEDETLSPDQWRQHMLEEMNEHMQAS